MHKILSVAALGVAFALPALATTTASISTGPLALGLVDLNAGDAVAPSFQWGSDWVFNHISHDGTQAGWHGETFSWGNGLVPDWSPLQSFTQGVLNQGLVSAASPLGFGSLLMQGNAGGLQNMQSSVLVQAGQQGAALTYYDRDFTLGAYTQLTFSVVVNGLVSNDGLSAAWTLPAGFSTVDSRSHAYGSVAMYVGDLNKRTEIGAVNTWPDTAAYEVTADGDVLRFTIKNTGAVDKAYHLTMLTSVQAYETIDPLSPVPEPDMLALMAVGLVGVTGLARRRRR